MFILVNKQTKVIIGSAIKYINNEANDSENMVYQIPDNEFSSTIVGMVLESFDEWND